MACIGGDCLKGADLAGGGSMQCGKLSLAVVAQPRRGDVDPPSPATLTAISSFQSISLNLLVVLVPLVHDESGQIVDTLFCAKWHNFDS